MSSTPRPGCSSARVRSSKRSRHASQRSRVVRPARSHLRVPAAEPRPPAEPARAPLRVAAVAVARVTCRAQLGLAAPLVQVEVSLAAGLPAFCIVGLPATVIKESKERVRAALTNSGFAFPAGRITVSLAPAVLPKEGGRFDLPIALGILLASGQLRGQAPRETPREFYGELGLTGELKPVRGLLLAAAHARRQGHDLVVPRGNALEACAAAPRQVRAAGHLLEVCAHLSGASPLPPHSALEHAATASDGNTA